VRDDANFEDVTHLNENGAKVFSAELARVLGRFGREEKSGTLPATVAAPRKSVVLR
jgi:hypothetical protein